MKRDYTRADHSVYHCDYHLVLVTKYRRNVIANEGIWAYIEQKLREVTEHYPRIRIKQLTLWLLCKYRLIHTHTTIPQQADGELDPKGD